MRPRHGRDRFHTVPISSMELNAFNKANVETRAHQAYRPIPPAFERRQEMFGTRMERVPTTRWNILRDRAAITLKFLRHNIETFFLWSLRLVFYTAAIHSSRSGTFMSHQRED